MNVSANVGPLPTQFSQIPTPVPPLPPYKNRSISLKQSHNSLDPTISWTASIAGHCRNGQLAEAVTLFTQMRLAGVEPNHITFVTFLPSCADKVLFGSSIHAYARKLGLDTNNVIMGTALIGMYAKCGNVGDARLVFDELSVKNMVSWNTMIDGFMRNGEINDAIELFEQMPERNAVSWTALISGFVKRGQFEQALAWFREMQLSGVEPDYVTIIAVLSACADLGTLGLGLWMNRLVMNFRLEDNIKICNSMIDMYSRCGCIDCAQQVFDKMTNRTVVSWNSIIVGLAVNGNAEEALNFFDLMLKKGFKPDGVSFTGALTACSHAGLIDEGLQLFHNMKRVHGIAYRIEHYGCLVDLYSRSGRLEDALNVIKSMPMKPNEVVLGSLLAACRTQGNVSLAERLMEYLFKLDPGVDSNYVLLANIYAASGRWDGAGKVRKKMKALGIQKMPGFSSIEIDCDSHKFVAGDKSHLDTECIYAMLELLSVELKGRGYVPESIITKSYELD